MIRPSEDTGTGGSGPEPSLPQTPVLSPLGLVAGFVVGMVLLSMAGRSVAHSFYFEDFHRLHRYINPETLYYPTSSQVINTAAHLSSSQQVLVITGGSSVMYGAGQGADEIWSDELQRQLGYGFSVVNLAQPGGAPTEHGAVAAQALARTGRNVIYLADTGLSFFASPDGVQFKYVYWDAFFKDQLQPYPVRDRSIVERGSQGKGQEDLEELQWRARLDSVLFFEDLWNAVAYHYVFTAWSYLMDPNLGPWWRPRRLVSDSPSKIDLRPPDERITPAALAIEMDITRSIALLACQQDSGEKWTPLASTDQWRAYERDITTAFAPDFRDRTLVIMSYYNQILLRAIGPDPEKCYDDAVEAVQTRLLQAGYGVAVIGKDYPADYYADRAHFTGEGGRALARELAPRIRQLAAKLGYSS